MPSLYGTGTSYTVTASNVISLYQVSTSSAVITATTYSTNLVGLYGGYWSPDPISQFVNTIVAGPGISVNTSSGNVTVSNTGVLSLTAGTATNVSSTTGNITVWATIPNSVNTLTAGAGISVSTSSGNVVITNTGVLSLIAGTAITVSTTTGNITVNNSGVTSLTAGTNTNISSTTGNITIWTNSFTGVTSITAGTNTNVSSTTGNITIWSNAVPTGVTSIAAGTGISVSTSTGSVTVTNVGVTGLIAGTNTNISSTTGNITIWSTPVATGVTSITASTGIGVSTSTGSVTITNLGVTNLTAGSAISVSGSTGSITITNTGVTSLTAGTNTNVSSTTGGITIWTNPINNGVTSLTAGNGISVSTSTGSVTITNIGVTSLTAGTNTNISSTTGNITIWTAPVSSGVTSITAGTNTNVSSTTGNITIWTNTASIFDISTWTNQRLFTTSSVQFSGITATTGTQVNQIVSSGGYPLDGNGQALINVNGTQSPALVVSNYTSGLRPTIQVRGYGQNYPGGTSTSSAASSLYLEAARGSNTATTPTVSGDTLGIIQFSGFDGQVWVGSSSTSANLPGQPASIYATAAETFANNGTTNTNAGTSMGFRVQPPAVQLDSTSRQNWLLTSWTAGSTATNSPPQLNVFLGNASQTSPILTPAGGVGSFNTGYGKATLVLPNTFINMFGVSQGDTAPDNPTLPGGNTINVSGSRQSGASGRRQPLQASDEVARLDFYAQTATNSTVLGGLASRINTVMLENATASTYGSLLQLKTVNSGTTSLNNRLTLSDRGNSYLSDSHTFTNAAGTTQRLSINTGTTFYYNDTHTFRNAALNVTLLTFTTGTTNYNNDTQNFNASSGSGARLILSTPNNINNYNSDTHTFNNTAGNTPTLSMTTGTNTYNNNTHAFNGAGGSQSIVTFTTSSGVNFKGYTESLIAAAYTATFAPNVSTATIWVMTLNGNITFNGFTNPVAGQSASFYFVQDSTGTRILSSTMKFAGGSKILSTGSGATDMIAVTYGGAAGYYASLVKGFV